MEHHDQPSPSASASTITAHPIVTFPQPVLAVSSALQANDAHRAALHAYRARLKKELEDANLMVQSVQRDVAPNVSEVKVKNLDEWAVFAVPGATNFRPLLIRQQLNADDSPFQADAANHRQYLAYTTTHPFTAKERSLLRKQVISENRRLTALELNRRGETESLDVVAKQPDNDFEDNVDGIDWRRVAANISETSRGHHPKRSAQDCKVQWIGTDHPRLYKTSQWSDPDDKLLEELVGDSDVRAGEVDWVELAKGFNGKRAPAHCLSRWLFLQEAKKSSAEPKVPWTVEEDAELQAAITEHGIGNWATISLAIDSTRSPVQCYHRYTQTAKADIKRGAWSEEEDARLKEAVALHGSKWARVKELLPGRTAAQCRERFVRAAATSATAKTGAWTKEEDTKLRQARVELSIKNWDDVAEHIGTRTSVQCRKRWNRIAGEDASENDGETDQADKQKKKSKPKASQKPKATASESKKKKVQPALDSSEEEADTPEESASPSEDEPPAPPPKKTRGRPRKNPAPAPIDTPEDQAVIPPSTGDPKPKAKPKPKPRFAKPKPPPQVVAEPSVPEASGVMALALAASIVEAGTESGAGVHGDGVVTSTPVPSGSADNNRGEDMDVDADETPQEVERTRRSTRSRKR